MENRSCTPSLLSPTQIILRTPQPNQAMKPRVPCELLYLQYSSSHPAIKLQSSRRNIGGAASRLKKPCQYGHDSWVMMYHACIPFMQYFASVRSTCICTIEIAFRGHNGCSGGLRNRLFGEAQSCNPGRGTLTLPALLCCFP